MTGGHPYIFNASEPIIGPRTPSGVGSANDAGTVCVRLDGLADKIAARVALAFEGEAEAWNLSTDSGDRLARIVAVTVERLLQSLAVQ